MKSRGKSRAADQAERGLAAEPALRQVTSDNQRVHHAPLWSAVRRPSDAQRLRSAAHVAVLDPEDCAVASRARRDGLNGGHVDLLRSQFP